MRTLPLTSGGGGRAGLPRTCALRGLDALLALGFLAGGFDPARVRAAGPSAAVLSRDAVHRAAS